MISSETLGRLETSRSSGITFIISQAEQIENGKQTASIQFLLVTCLCLRPALFSYQWHAVSPQPALFCGEARRGSLLWDHSRMPCGSAALGANNVGFNLRFLYMLTTLAKMACFSLSPGPTHTHKQDLVSITT